VSDFKHLIGIAALLLAVEQKHHIKHQLNIYNYINKKKEEENLYVTATP
jgi:hypothetical protein